MHEMTLAEGILEIVVDAASARAAQRVSTVRLELGALAQVERDALLFCFDIVTRDTLAEGARLEILEAPGRAWCVPCGESVELNKLGDACPRCGSYQLQVTDGKAMRVKDIEIA